MEINNNKITQRFEYKKGDEIAYLEYRFYKNKNIAFMHTLVPETLAGKGIASALAKAAFEYAKEIKKPVMVYCPFVSAYLKRHPELNIYLDPELYKQAKR